ncbi:MAG: prealbumin-like fold domain-containing protein [Cytophagales bacterium]|nr:prealbumin-like fold domain-containing protein [Bernardetiaceae bacterium]MDW8211459.1 prealbumin-like fold domain-containing protein [Cytophagales bacterium]
MTKTTIHFTCWCLLALTCGACSREEVMPIGFALKIKVVNFRNEPVEGATVTLYADQEAFIKDQKTIPPKQTNRNGEVIFEGLPFGVMGYFASAELGTANNWSNPLEASISFNTRDIEYVKTLRISEASIQNALAGRFSRRWRRVSYNLNGTVHTSCLFTQVYEFRRDNFIHIFNASGCPNAGHQTSALVWSVAPDNRGIILGSITSGRQLAITDLTPTMLRTTETPQPGIIIIEEYRLVE